MAWLLSIEQSHTASQVFLRCNSTGEMLVVPTHMREALQLNVGDRTLLRVEDGEFQVISKMEAIRRAQQLIAQCVQSSVSLINELIADRRTEVAKVNIGR